MTNPTVQTDISELLKAINDKLDAIDDRLGKKIDGIEARLGKLEVGQAEIKGDLKTLDAKFTGEFKTVTGNSEQLEKRIANQEFFTRVIGGSLVVSILSGIAGFFLMFTKLVG